MPDLLLRRRSEQAEIIDDPALPEGEFAAALDDLSRVNFWLRGHAPTLAFLRERTKGLARFTLLDVGAGQGDLLRAIERWARRSGIEARLTGIDLASGGALASGRAGTDAAYIVGDVFDHRPAKPYDFIVSSLFTHHLADAEIVRFIRWMQAHAQLGWHINDLHRHPLALAGYSALSAVMRWHPIVRHDGRISVRRAFARRDLQTYLDAAGVTGRIEWHPLFRWSVASG